MNKIVCNSRIDGSVSAACSIWCLLERDVIAVRGGQDLGFWEERVMGRTGQIIGIVMTDEVWEDVQNVGLKCRTDTSVLLRVEWHFWPRLLYRKYLK